MRRANEQGGSIVGFLVACVILAALLVGGVYALRHSDWFDKGLGSQIAKTDDTKKDAKDGDSSKSDTKKSDTSTKETDEKTKKTDETATTSDQSDKKSTESATSDRVATEEDGESVAETPHTGMNSQAVEALPTTGPGDTFFSMIGASLLAAAGISYFRSTRL